MYFLMDASNMFLWIFFFRFECFVFVPFSYRVGRFLLSRLTKHVPEYEGKDSPQKARLCSSSGGL